MMYLFLNGFYQLFQLPAHVLFLITLGLSLGQQFGLHPAQIHASRHIALPLPTLVLSLMCGLILGLQKLPAWPYELGILFITLLLGMCVILQWRLALWGLLCISSSGGILLGLIAEPLILPSFSAEKISSILAGITVGGGILCAGVTLIASVLGRFWQGLGIRIIGSWVTACVLLVLALHWLGNRLPSSA